MEFLAVPYPDKALALRRLGNLLLSLLLFGRNRFRFSNFLCTNLLEKSCILSRFSLWKLSILLLKRSLLKYYPSYCLPILGRLLVGFFRRRHTSTNLLSLFHNVLPLRRLKAICTYIRVEGNARLLLRLLSKVSRCVFEFF